MIITYGNVWHFFPSAADTYHDPQPFIDKSEAQHPVVNSTFTLKCTVNVDPGTRLFVEWIYPNKNVSMFYVYLQFND